MEASGIVLLAAPRCFRRSQRTRDRRSRHWLAALPAYPYASSPWLRTRSGTGDPRPSERQKTGPGCPQSAVLPEVESDAAGAEHGRADGIIYNSGGILWSMAAAKVGAADEGYKGTRWCTSFLRACTLNFSNGSKGKIH